MSGKTPGAPREFFQLPVLSTLRVYKLTLRAEGGEGCDGGFLPRWLGDVYIEQADVACPD
jgi:hypothetical protein